MRWGVGRRAVLAVLLVVLGGMVARAESTTVEFDFTENKYGFPVTTDDNENEIKATIKDDNENVSITIGSLWTGSNYQALWKQSVSALCYEYNSFIVFTASEGSYLESISLVFADSNNAGGRNYFYKTHSNLTATLEPYVYDADTNIGTLTITEEDCSTVEWVCKDKSKMDLSKIIVTYYSEDTMVGVDEVAEGRKWSVSGNGGRVTVSGEARSIEIYGINGMLLARNKRELACPAGIYIVRIDGTAQKLIVH